MSFLVLPDQSIPETQKTKEWHIQHALDYVSFSVNDNYNDQRQEMLKLFRAYNAELNEEELAATKAITCPNGIYLGQEYIVYPLIQTKIEQLVGDFMRRPINRKAYVIDKKSKNKKYDKKLSMLAEKFTRQVVQDLEGELGFKAETQNPELQIPENIDEHDFKMIAEEVADGLIRIFLDVRKEKDKFKNMFTKYAITDRAHCILDKKHGYTTARDVHPMDCDHDSDPYKVVQDNHEYFFENYYLTENEIYNNWRLSRAEKKMVKRMFESFVENTDSTNFDSQELSTSYKYNGWFRTSNKVHRCRVVNVMWKSRVETRIKVAESKPNKDGKTKTFYKKLDPDYQERKKDKIEYIEGEKCRHVLMLGPDICLDWGEMDLQLSHVDDPFTKFLPVVSIIRDNPVGTSLIKSVAAKLYQLQQMASEVLFEIRFALKSAGDSRVLVYDAAQTPKEFTKKGYESGLNRVMHHIKKDKLMIINSKQKGNNASFNQFTSLDLSQKGAVQDLFNGLAIIEDLADKFIGMAPEREGQVHQNQTATGTDKAIRGSFARTEIIYTPFDEFIQAILERVLLRGKHDYEKGQVLYYIFGEMKGEFLKIFDDFFASDFGIYLSNAGRDQEMAERINRAAEMALSNANSIEIIKGLIDIFDQETALEKKKVFDDMIASMQKLQEQRAKAEQEMAAMEAEEKQKDRDKDITIAREGDETEKDVAEIYVRGKANSDATKANSNERIEAARLSVQDRQQRQQEKQ